MDKNEFVLELKDYFSNIHEINNFYIYGKGDFEGRKDESGYSLVKKLEGSHEDLRGFSFNKKEVVNSLYEKSEDFKKNILNFLKSKNLESTLDGKGALTLHFDDKKYYVSIFVGKGSLDEVSIYLIDDFVPELKN